MASNQQVTQHTGTQKDRKEKEQLRRELLSKYIYDVSKLFIAGMFLLNIVPIIEGTASMTNYISGIFVALSAIGLAWAANRILIY